MSPVYVKGGSSPSSVQPSSPRHLLGTISWMPAYETKIMPQPNPIIVEPAATVSVVLAVQATICGGLAYDQLVWISGHTDPRIASTSPETIVHLLPKMSEAEPAMQKLTEDAMDQPPTIQVIFAVSPSRSVAMGTRILVTKTKPQEIGQTYDSDNDYLRVSNQ
jgi:hypothetical protein